MFKNLLHIFLLRCFSIQPPLTIGAIFLSAQAWAKCTSLDSSRCVAYFGTKFKTIWAASKKGMSSNKTGLVIYSPSLFFTSNINFVQTFYVLCTVRLQEKHPSFRSAYDDIVVSRNQASMITRAAARREPTPIYASSHRYCKRFIHQKPSQISEQAHTPKSDQHSA